MLKPWSLFFFFLYQFPFLRLQIPLCFPWGDYLMWWNFSCMLFQGLLKWLCADMALTESVNPNSKFKTYWNQKTFTDTRTWVLRLPSNSEATSIESVVRAKPEIQWIMGAVKLLGVILATVCSNYVGTGSVPIMNLKEVKVAVGAALQIEERKGDTKNLMKRKTEFKFNCQSATCEILYQF